MSAADRRSHVAKDDGDSFWLFHLFVNSKFTFHRILGLAYLLQYAYATYLYWTNYEQFLQSVFIWSLPLNGVVQSCTATYYFRFLSKTGDPGYYSDKGTLTWSFVAENIFYSSILLWQWLYMSDRFFPSLKKGFVFEVLFVFLPYFAFRPFFPKTSFRDSFGNDNRKTDENRSFFFWATWITKAFYPWAKWAIGFLLNYLRYAEKLTPVHIRFMYGLLLFACWATTISLFTHTLRFKGYISGPTSFGTYMFSYMCTFYFIVRLSDAFVASPLLCCFAFLGLFLNSLVPQLHAIFWGLQKIVHMAITVGSIKTPVFVPWFSLPELRVPAMVQHAAQAGIAYALWAHRTGRIDLTPYGL